ncbi:MAG TPA: hypothetical protein VK797_08900 [Tepidisphaeraceae bacterium]|nr:hypothetical protein [Tepidisphaeraceae bacterium]
MANESTPNAVAGSSGITFWISFVVAAGLGVGVANILDEAIYHFLTGGYPDGGATLVSVAGIPLGAIAVGITRSVRTPQRTGWAVAALSGLLASPLTITLLYAFWR